MRAVLATSIPIRRKRGRASGTREVVDGFAVELLRMGVPPRHPADAATKPSPRRWFSQLPPALLARRDHLRVGRWGDSGPLADRLHRVSRQPHLGSNRPVARSPTPKHHHLLSNRIRQRHFLASFHQKARNSSRVNPRPGPNTRQHKVSIALPARRVLIKVLGIYTQGLGEEACSGDTEDGHLVLDGWQPVGAD